MLKNDLSALFLLKGWMDYNLLEQIYHLEMDKTD